MGCGSGHPCQCCGEMIYNYEYHGCRTDTIYYCKKCKKKHCKNCDYVNCWKEAKIKDIGKAQPKISPEEFAKALGAEIITDPKKINKLKKKLPPHP